MLVVDSSVLIDVLRDTPGARPAIKAARREHAIHSSVVVRAEVLAGMRSREEAGTRMLLDTLRWHDVDLAISEEAGILGRRWSRSHSGIDISDYLIAATASMLGCSVLTRNVKHFPMFPDLQPPY
jgi:predicted nucleic acid-binding protein